MFCPGLSKEDQRRLDELSGHPSVIEQLLGRDDRKQRLAREVKVTEKHRKITYESQSKKTKVKEYYP